MVFLQFRDVRTSLSSLYICNYKAQLQGLYPCDGVGLGTAELMADTSSSSDSSSRVLGLTSTESIRRGRPLPLPPKTLTGWTLKYETSACTSSTAARRHYI